MGNIFDEQKLYPHQGTIKSYFKDHYNSVFIALLPFFQLDRKETDKANLKKAKLLSHEEALKKIDFLKNLPEANREIYNYDNERYPSDKDIFREGKAICWNIIVNGSPLKGNDVEVIRIEGTAIPGLQETAFQTAINSIEKAFRQIPA